jgi:hypothetical protein
MTIYRIFNYVTNKARLKRDVRFLFQRLTRGWDDSETWSMDSSIAKLILPRLIRFKELHNGHPVDLTEAQWEQILTEIIWAFEWFASGKQYEVYPDYQMDLEVVNAALGLFAKYYRDLWW